MPHVPRLIIPHNVITGVIRTVDQAFFLKPTQKVKNIIGACMGRALKKHPVRLHAALANTNHLHTELSVCEDTLKNAAPFFRHLHGLLARELNRHWKRQGHLWSGRVRLELCVDDGASESMLAYIMSNPLKDDLVESLAEWKGFSTHHQLLTGEPVEYDYTDLGAWWKQGGPLGRKTKEDFRRTASVHTTPLPHWEGLAPEEQHRRYAHLIDTAERVHKERRAAEGKTVLGMPAIIRQSHTARPKRKFVRKKRKPLCHASCQESWFCFMEMWKEFLKAYRQASAFYRRGILDVEFPPGSYRPPLISINGPP